MRLLPALFLLSCSLILGGCENLKMLKEDLLGFNNQRRELSGLVTGAVPDQQSVVVIYLGSADGANIVNYQMRPGAGDFKFWVLPQDGWFFAYADLNNDLVFQPNEPYGWHAKGRAYNPANFGKSGSVTVPILPAGSAQLAPPSQLINRDLNGASDLQNIVMGEVTSLADSRFSRENAQKGLWQPYTSAQEKLAGIYFLEPYAPNRIPVLLIHGIGGTPRDFTTLISRIDQDRFQVWVMNYPSGLRLNVVSSFLFQSMSMLRHQYGFDQLKVVAHSMGGLVAQSYANMCMRESRCDYLESVSTIATPFGGVKFAGMGVDYSPVVMPVWNDLSPNSEFLKSLFDIQPAGKISFNLFFAYRLDNIIGTESSDGVIALASQLRLEAQIQADRVLGFDKTHVGVLNDPKFIAALNGVLEGS